MKQGPRCWQDDDTDRIVVWQPASPPLAVEGPLELACFEGSVLVLQLAPEQLVLRQDRGRLQQVLLGDVHRLEIATDKGSLPPSSSLLFLRPDVPIDLRWRHQSCLILDRSGSIGAAGHDRRDRARDAALRLPLRGICRLHIAEPMLFYAAFLQNLEGPAQDAMQGVLDTLVRTLLATHLEPLLHAGELDCLHAQALVTDLDPADLSEDLAEFGLGCLHLAVCLPRDHQEPTSVATAVSLLPASFDDMF